MGEKPITREKIIRVFISFLFIITIIFPSANGFNKEYLENDTNGSLMKEWGYQTDLYLEHPTPIDNYQKKIIIDAESFEYSNANPDGSDIRFYDETGEKLSYWIEEWNPEGVSTIWVKVLKIGTKKIQLYYGNSQAKSESNGNETFVFFDDFSGNNLNTNKWEIYFEPKDLSATVSEGELTVKDRTGSSSYLISKDLISTGTRTIVKFKEKKTGGTEPEKMYIGLLDDPYDIKNAIYSECCPRWPYYSWGFVTKSNGFINSTECDGLQGFYNYRVNEYRWDKNKAEYYCNDILKTINYDCIPTNDLHLAIRVTYFNSFICDWIIVTNLVEEQGELKFNDTFDDNEKNLIKWSEFYNDGTWNETNNRTELKVYEYEFNDPITYEGIRSSNFVVNLSQTKSVKITWDWITQIESNGGLVGNLYFKLTDSSNYIMLYYNKDNNNIYYEDSTIPRGKTISIRDDGVWDNEILVFSDRYHVRSDDNNSGWVYNNNIFSSNPILRIEMYISGGVDNSSHYYVAGFDNVKVEIPIYGKQRPFPPNIKIPDTKLLPLLDHRFVISATDPDLDNVSFYIEWGENENLGEWIFVGDPKASDENVLLNHRWFGLGTYIIKIKAIDVHGTISNQKEQKITIGFIKNKSISYIFRLNNLLTLSSLKK
jgi:hypothetical protein